MSSWQDPEFRREYHRQRYLKNKEEVKRRRVERYWKDVEYSRQKSREYWQNNNYSEKYNTTEKKDAWKKRYYQALSESIEKLGGKCVKCGATERLEFDHIDPKNKSFEITRKFLMGDKEKFQEELDKCQLLCYDCHLEKTKQSYLNGEFK